MSGAQRLPNGNTLICDSVSGTIFEVTLKDEIVWKYTCAGTVKSRTGASGGPLQSIEILASFLRDLLKMSPEQKKDLDEFQKEIDSKLDSTLTDEQKKRLREKDGSGSGAIGGFALPGQILSLSRQASLAPTDEQKRQLAKLQDEVDDKLDQLLTADQKAHLKKMKEDFVRRGRLRAGTGRLSGAPGKNTVFRAYRYGTDYAGLAGKDLKPGQTIDELEELKRANESAKK